MKKQFYILATPASGKTTFLEKNGNLHGNLTVYDLDKVKKQTEAEYRDYRAFEKLPEDVAILGGIAGKNFLFNTEKCVYLAVVIPKEDLLRNIKLRANDKKAKRNKWKRKENVLNSYKELKTFIKNNNIRSFSSFKEVLDYIDNAFYNEKR